MIRVENEQIMKRIMSQKSTLNIKKLNKDYKQQKQIMNRILKNNNSRAVLSNLMKVKNKINDKVAQNLPPIYIREISEFNKMYF